MIKILTLFKIIPDYDAVLQRDWNDIESLDTAFVPRLYDTFDEGALEGALRLKAEFQEKGKEVFCTAIGAGEKSGVLLSELYAAGFDEVLYLNGDERDEESLSLTLISCIHEQKPDIIFTGRSDGALSTRITAAKIAEALRLPWLMDVTETHASADLCGITAVYETDTEYVRVSQDLPCICSYGNAVCPSLRMITLKERLSTKKREVIEKNMAGHGDCVNDILFSVPGKKKNCRVIEGNPEEKIQWLNDKLKEGRQSN